MVVAARSADKASEVFSEAGLKEGYQVPAEGSSASSGGSGGILITEAGVDVTNPDTLTKQLFEGVTQVRVCVHGVGRLAGCIAVVAKEWGPKRASELLDSNTRSRPLGAPAS